MEKYLFIVTNIQFCLSYSAEGYIGREGDYVMNLGEKHGREGGMQGKLNCSGRPWSVRSVLAATSE